MSILTTIKQDGFIDSSKLAKWNIKVFGIGSIGATLIHQLAMVGFESITGYDFDTVDEENIGSQIFRKRHIGMKKTEALQQMMKEDYDMEIAVIDGKIDEKTEIMPEDNTLYFCSFDSLEARQMLWDKLKTFPIVWGESRIGRTSQRYYFIDLRLKDEEWKKKYEATLSTDGPRTELKCGEKGSYPSNAELCGKICRQVVNIAEEKPLTTMFIGDWGNPHSVFVAPEEEVPSEISYD